MIKGVLLDLSGTLYLGNQILHGAVQSLDRLRDKGLPVRYVTNSSRSTRQMIHDKLQRMGLDIDRELIFTAPKAVHRYLREHSLRPSLLIHPDLEAEFSDLSTENPNAVVVGDAADGFTYANLNRVFRLLLEGAAFLAVGDNRYFMTRAGMCLDAGPFVRALEFASGTEAVILGKPSGAFFHAAVESLGCRPEEALMIGDDVSADVNGALQAGLQAILVQTGKYLPDDDERIVDPGAKVCRDVLEAIESI